MCFCTGSSDAGTTRQASRSLDRICLWSRVDGLLGGSRRLLSAAGLVVHIATAYAGVSESMRCHRGRAEQIASVNHNLVSQQFTQAIEIDGAKFFPVREHEQGVGVPGRFHD